MSKFDPVPTAQAQDQTGFAASYEKLAAAESVRALIANMTEAGKTPIAAPDRYALEQSYGGVQSYKRARFETRCADLAILAKTGVSALLQAKAAGRTNLDAATTRLVSEIDNMRVQVFRSLGH